MPSTATSVITIPVLVWLTARNQSSLLEPQPDIAIAPETETGFTNLQSLSLIGTQASDVSALAGLANLQSLDLAESEVNDISALDHLTGLTIRFW